MLINNNDNKLKSVGGQAVIEGVMMKSPKNWTVAVRDQKGEIHIKKEKLAELPKFLKMPVLRGVVALVQALGLGIKAIEFSAGKAYEEESEKGMGKLTMSLTILISILLGIALFILFI
jgi:uncharacterized protein YqhQ